MSDAPIGIFDSGVGGLTVARAVRDQLPNEAILYVGDLEHSPYGPKPIADVRRYALAVLDDLVAQGVKMLVIACNTASSAMLRDARERYDVPVVEVIQPAVRRAVATTRTGRVGVIGTAGTVQSRAYDDAFAAAPHLELSSAACPRFVEFVESGLTTGPEVLAVAEEYLAPLRAAGVDTLVLGCTHYPFLKGAISYVMGEGVSLVSSDVETANDVYRVLVSQGLERRSPEPPVHRFEATGDSSSAFLDLAHRLIGPEISQVELVQTGVLTLPVAAASAAPAASSGTAAPAASVTDRRTQ
ncbi:glutamate racemase [Agromyces kandeliae]|uniref:Glutamate racemase n=1 Tax=Agromyces kandeliae TaxID=2666141 RepID=A0A6L5R5U9_9MICO|nr:glutamate racemase [Agromyces kandeliae]